MKTIYTLVLSLFTLALFAQKPVEVEDIKKNMSDGEHVGMSVLIHDATQEMVKKPWEDAIRGKSKSKAQTVGEEIQIIGTIIPLISNDSMNIYSLFTPSKDGIKLDVWFELKEHGYIDVSKEKFYLPAKKFLFDFAVKQYKEVVKQEIEVAEDELDDLDKDYKKLAKDHDKLLATVSDSKVKIENTKNEISTNESDQERQRSLIQAQKKKVYEAAKLSDDAKKQEEKNLKSLEKDLDKMVKENEKLHDKIVDYEADIREAEREIKENETSRELKTDEIEAHKKLIAKLKDKLEKVGQ